MLTHGSKAKEEIQALQTLLNERGFGAALNWEKYGADGLYGNNTAAAVALFSQLENIKCPEGRLTYGKYPLPDADKRAAVTKKYLDNGTIISAGRGSFRYDLKGCMWSGNLYLT